MFVSFYLDTSQTQNPRCICNSYESVREYACVFKYALEWSLSYEFISQRAPAEQLVESNMKTFMVGAETQELLFRGPNDDAPVASVEISSLFSSRFVMVVSTQWVLSEK